MNRIKELRKRNRMSQISLSIKLEVSQETVSAYENEKYYPSFETLVKLSEIFNTSIDYIMGLTDSEGKKSDKNNEAYIISLFRQLSDIDKELVFAYINGILDSKMTKNN